MDGRVHSVNMEMRALARELLEDLYLPLVEIEVEQLRRFALRTWLHPVGDSRRWRPALRRLPLRVWPMSRAGMLGAAYELAVDEDRSGGTVLENSTSSPM